MIHDKKFTGTDPFGELGGRGEGARGDILVLEVSDEDAAPLLAVVRHLRFLGAVVAPGDHCNMYDKFTPKNMPEMSS